MPDSPDRSKKSGAYRVASTHERLASESQFTGRGVTIAMLDSGFQRHPDLTTPKNRILAVVDSLDPSNTVEPATVQGWQWHGTQTSVVAAGNGHLSGGQYRSFAPDARVVLVKLGKEGRISDEHIARGLEWVLENQKKYRIDIVSISAGGDEPIPYTSSVADQAAEEAVRRRIVVVVAAGNSGFEQHHLPMPPANAPSVITVGGYDDKGKLGGQLELYRSSFGPTVDGLLKPEVIAPAAWVVAPILVGTDQEAKAATLFELVETVDAALPARVATLGRAAGLEPGLERKKPAEIRAAIDTAVRAAKFVSPKYQHVDGTSFATPIVSSVVAQMIESNPDLKPNAIKHILCATADRIDDTDVYRQGFGILDPKAAVEQARRAPGGLPAAYFGLPAVKDGVVTFYFLDPTARAVAIAGDFNGWNPTATPLERDPNGLWHVRVPVHGIGLLRYKIVVDGDRWIEDPNNWIRVPAEAGGLVSALVVSN